MRIFTFWEPRTKLPGYLKLCMKTWEKYIPNAEIIVLDYSNLGDWIDISEFGPNLLDGRFSLPMIADAIRVMLLEKYDGLWMDADTIILNKNIVEYFKNNKECSMFGYKSSRAVHIAWINSVANSNIMKEWLQYQKDVISNFKKPDKDFWAYLGNSFVNPYCKLHIDDIGIWDVYDEKCMPELKIAGVTHQEKYREFYFKSRHKLKDIDTKSLIMLHNSWTPVEYKSLSEEEFMKTGCTLANILTEVLEGREKKIPNQYILHKIDGTTVFNPVIPGLNVVFKDLGGVVELFEPVGKFEVSTIICGKNSKVSIESTYINQIRHGLNINAAASNNKCVIGKNFSCWNAWITLIDEENLGVFIGEDVMLSSGVEFRPSDAHVIFDKDTKKLLNAGEDIECGNHVWICKNVLINKGSKIANNTVVSAYSKVTGKFFEEYTVIGGIPAKVLKHNVNWDRKHPDKWEDKI